MKAYRSALTSQGRRLGSNKVQENLLRGSSWLNSSLDDVFPNKKLGGPCRLQHESSDGVRHGRRTHRTSLAQKVLFLLDELSTGGGSIQC